MTRLKIFPGSCGFITKLAIWKIDKWTVGVEIKSECERLKGSPLSRQKIGLIKVCC
jgi:hypothetical protein